MPHRIVGIRPGEKLHETMLTEGDARSTVEMPDRYVIEPALSWWDRTTFDGSMAKRVSEDFRYSSDSNPEWLAPERLHGMLQESA
jgi:UDP-N-acetylglucosamine 4,6-dehydratase